MYKLVNLSKYYNSDNKVNKALDNISLEIKDKEFVMISGPSGSGKSTLLNVLSGIDNYQEGEMYFDNKETSYFDEKDYEKFRYDNISFVFQEYNLLESFTCYENIEVALISKNINYSHEDIINLLKKVNLEDKEKVKAAKLSGGQKARLAIARALAFNAKILVLDEPTGALDSNSSNDVVNLLKELKGTKTIILVTHNEELFKDIANHHIKILDGKIKEDRILEETQIKEINEKYETKEYKKEAKISLLNIKNQPKKSILSFSLCFVLTLFIFLIISNLSYMGRKEDTSSYIERSLDRVMVYNEEGFTDNDIDELNKNSYRIIQENNLLQSSLTITGLTNHNMYINGALDISSLKDDELIIGSLPKNNDEVVIAYDKNILDSWDYYQNKRISININDDKGKNSILYKAKIVGMASTPKYYFKDGLNIDLIENGFFNDRINFEHADIIELILDYSLDEDKLYKNNDLKLFIDDNLVDAIHIPEEGNIKPTIKCNPSYLTNIFNKRNTISVFTNDPQKYVKNLDAKYDFYIPNVVVQEVDFQRMIITFLSVIMGGLIYLLVFLTNYITKQIYRYKNKDNAILNSLGYSASTLKKSLALELVSNYAIAIIIMIICVILDLTTNCFKGFLSYNSIYSYLIILIVIGLAIYSGIKNVFKMFQSNSLFKNLRGGGDLDA